MAKPLAAALLRFFSNPVVGVVGVLASLAGVGLSIYFYVASQSYAQLAYFVHPVRTTILTSGLASTLSVSAAGEPITTDVSAVQVAVWNDGRLPIKAANILEPISIGVGVQPGIRILEARLTKQSRHVVGLAINSAEGTKGMIGLNWTILEHNDGATIQIIYSGGIDAPVNVQGVVEGQRPIRKFSFPGTIRSPEEQFARSGQESQRVAKVLFVVGAAMAAAMLLGRRRLLKLESARIMSIILFASLFYAVAVMIFAVVLFITGRPIVPSFLL